MAKFNSKTVSGPTETNFMGSKAYKLSPKEELASKVMTTFLNDGYYVSERELVDKILELTDAAGSEFAAKLAIYARTKGNMRSSSHLLAAKVCADKAHPDWLKSFYENIVLRPDDIAEILSCYANLNGIDLAKGTFKKIPNSMKKGFGKVLSNLSPYQIDKYKMNGRQLSLVDIMNLIHPVPTKKNEEAYRRLMHGESLDGTYSAKILEKEMSAAGKKADSDEGLVEAKHDAIKAVLDKGMPIMNLLRNLRNIALYAPDLMDEALNQLTNRDKVINSKLLPFRFMSAYDAISELTLDDYNEKTASGISTIGTIAFESDLPKMTYDGLAKLKTKILKGIDKAMTIACENVPDLEGNCAVLVDHSGSVRGDWHGSSKVSPWSNVRTAHIGNLFASIITHKQKDVYFGMFGDRLISPKIDRSEGLLAFNKKTYDKGAECGGSTEKGIYDFFKAAVKEKKHIDNLIVFSDMEIGDGGSTGWYGFSESERNENFQKLFRKFREINPNCLVVCCNIHGESGTSVFNPKWNILNVTGWSNSIFDIIKMYKAGYIKSMVEEIEKIDLYASKNATKNVAKNNNNDLNKGNN